MVPAESVLTVRDATPLVRAALPMLVAPSKKDTLPVGVPLVDVTVAVSTALAPAATGLGVAVSMVVVAVALTTSATLAEVLVAKVVVPA